MRILVVANKTWECEPLVNVLLAKDARPGVIPAKGLRVGYHPAEAPPAQPPPAPPEADGLPVTGQLPVRPRLHLTLDKPYEDTDVEVWCIEDWMRRERRIDDPPPGKTVKASSSSSHEKFTFALPQIRNAAFGGDAPDLVIAFGTAGVPAAESLNGCVTIGSRVYLRDPWSDAPHDELAEQVRRFGPLLTEQVHDDLGHPIESAVDADFFKFLDSEARHSAEARFLRPPVHPAEPPRVLAGRGFAALSTLNICDYDDYVWADAETLEIYAGQVKQREIGSMETTHGLIRLTWRDVPFLFVSAITDRVPMFNLEVTPRKYAQNLAAAHNAGVAVAFLLPEARRLRPPPSSLTT
jgi:hypothetical protein